MIFWRVAAIRASGLNVKADDGKFSLYSRPGLVLRYDEPSEDGKTTVVQFRLHEDEDPLDDDEPSGAAGSAPKPVAVLRSPEGVVYYLGELARAHLDGQPSFVGIARASRKEKFFVLDEDPQDAIVSVSFDGVRYGIPRDSGRSMHCLSLLSQLISLYKSADGLPRTTGVTIVGN